MDKDTNEIKAMIEELTKEVKRLSKRVAVLEGDSTWKPLKRKPCPYCKGTGKVKDHYDFSHLPHPYYYSNLAAR